MLAACLIYTELCKIARQSNFSVVGQCTLLCGMQEMPLHSSFWFDLDSILSCGFEFQVDLMVIYPDLKLE